MSERKVGTISRGIRCPIIREGDNLADIVVTSVLEAAESEEFALRDRDVIAVTESVVARAQGNCPGNRGGCKGKAWRRNCWCDFPDSVKKPFCNLFKGNCHGRKKSCADVKLSQ